MLLALMDSPGHCCATQLAASSPHPHSMVLPCRMLAYGSKFLHPDTTSAADDIIACFCHVAATTMYLKHETMGQVGT